MAVGARIVIPFLVSFNFTCLLRCCFTVLQLRIPKDLRFMFNVFVYRLDPFSLVILTGETSFGLVFVPSGTAILNVFYPLLIFDRYIKAFMYVHLYFVQVLTNTWLAHAAVNCSETGGGRFADPDDDTCRNYTICIYVKDTDIYIMYNTICPNTSVFDPKASKCTSPDRYDCSKRTAVVSIPEQFKICSSDGYIEDPDHTNCSTYIQCVNILGAFTQLRHSCPPTTYYNPNTTLCDPFYKCPKEWTCSSPGRFANTLDSTCHKYYYCIEMSNGTLAQYDFVCPADTMFHAITKLCTTEYRCH